MPGIAPTLTFASLSVRPLFLSLIDNYLTDLEPSAIRPALKAIILALLPGLEEETSEDFEPTLRIINKFRDVAGQMSTRRPSIHADTGGEYFWQCLFLASITNPSRRLGVLAYLNRHLPKMGIVDHKAILSEQNGDHKIPEDLLVAANSVISPEPGLLIRCFATGLSDEQLLVQRNFLDLLVTHLPLHSPILQSRITEDDRETLVVAAAGVVTRRDMSLNRRLWAWFLGPEPASVTNDRQSFESAKSPPEISHEPVGDAQEHSQSQYFSRFGLKPLVQGLLKMVESDSKIPSERTRPFRISLSLMDRWEVGGSVVPAVFLPLMRSVQSFENVASRSEFDEVFRSASAFFDGVESSLIFSELLCLIDAKLADIDANIEKVLNDLKLANFILANFNVREEEMLLIHIPLLILSLLVKKCDLSLTEKESLRNPDNRKAASNQLMKVMNHLIGLLPERAFLRKAAAEKSATSHTALTEMSGGDILRKIHDFYDQSKDNIDLPPLPFAPKVIGELILRESHRLVLSALEGHNDSLSVKDGLNLFIALLKKTPKSRILRDGKLYSALYSRLNIDEIAFTTPAFSVVSSITSAATSLYSIQTPGFYISYEQISDLVPVLVRHIWRFLSPSGPKFHVEAVRCLWLLHSISCFDHLVEASITSLMIGSSSSESSHVTTAEQAEKFFVLWNHSYHGTYEPPPIRTTEGQSLSGKALGQDRSWYQSSMLQRPLFIVLDLLSQGLNEASQRVHEWLQDLPSIAK